MTDYAKLAHELCHEPMKRPLPDTVEVMCDGRYALATVELAVKAGYVILSWETPDGTGDYCVRRTKDVLAAVERKEAVVV